MKKLIMLIMAMFLLWTTDYGLRTVNAAIPHLINYQGRLTDASGTPLNGSYSITFRIYDAETAGNLLWQGTHNNVAISKGIFNILLGDINDPGYNFQNLAFDKPYFLEIKVGEDEPMKPRQMITSSGYAIRAETAQSSEGIEIRTSDPTSPTPGQIWLKTNVVNTDVIRLASTNHTYTGTTYGSGDNSIDGDFSTYQADSTDQQLGNGNYTKTSISQHTWTNGININTITYKIRTRAHIGGVQGTSYEYHQKVEYTTDGTNWMTVPGTLIDGGPFGSNEGDKDVTTHRTITPNLTGVKGIRAYCSVYGQQNDGVIFLANQIYEIQAFSNMKIGLLRVYDGSDIITIGQ